MALPLRAARPWSRRDLLGHFKDQHDLLAERNYFTRLQYARSCQSLAVDKRPVGGAEIFQHIFPALKGEAGMPA